MSSLTGNLISNTYQGLLKTSGSSAITSTLIPITDGLGNNTALSLSTETGSIDGDLIVTGVIHGIATQAVTASYAITASYLSGSITNAVSSSYAANADLLDGKNSTVFATTGSNTLVGNQIVSGSITPGGLAYDLGTINAPWRDLYVSTGSIKFTNNGVVVSTLGVGTDGTQITGSLAVSSSILLQSGNPSFKGVLKAWENHAGSGGIVLASTGSICIYSTGSNQVIGLGVNLNPPVGYPQISNIGLAINTAYLNYGPGSATIGGPKDGSRGGLLALRSFYDNTEWTISQTTNSSNNLIIQVNGYPDLQQNQILFKPVDYGTNTYNIKFNVNGILPETDSGNTYNLGSEEATWNNTYTNNLNLTPQTQPLSPVPGQIYFDTGNSHFYGWNGTTWKQLDN